MAFPVRAMPSHFRIRSTSAYSYIHCRDEVFLGWRSMGAIEQLIYTELQARILRNKYKPSPEERDVLQRCRSKALRRACLGGAAAAAAVWVFMSRPMSTSWGASGLLRWSLWRPTGVWTRVPGWKPSAQRTPTSEFPSSSSLQADLTGKRSVEGSGSKPEWPGSGGPAAEGASSQRSTMAQAPAWGRGLLVACGTLLGAYYGAQSTGTRCLEDVLALGQRSAMANEIRTILLDAEILLDSMPEGVLSVDASQTQENDVLVSLPGPSAGEVGANPTPSIPNINLFTEGSLRILRKGVNRDEIGRWLQEHDSDSPLTMDGFSAAPGEPWSPDLGGSATAPWDADEPNENAMTANGPKTADEYVTGATAEPTAQGFDRCRHLQPRIGPSLPAHDSRYDPFAQTNNRSLPNRPPALEDRSQRPLSSASPERTRNEPRRADLSEPGSSGRVPWLIKSPKITDEQGSESEEAAD
jgi:hypothetical protein